MKPKQQLIYLPIKIEDDFTFLITEDIKNYLNSNCHIEFYKDGKCIYTPAFITETHRENQELEHLNTHRLDKTEAIIFTPEELNEYTQQVIKDALKVASEKAEIKEKWCGSIPGFQYLLQYVEEQSITNTFEQIYEKWKI